MSHVGHLSLCPSRTDPPFPYGSSLTRNLVRDGHCSRATHQNPPVSLGHETVYAFPVSTGHQGHLISPLSHTDNRQLSVQMSESDRSSIKSLNPHRLRRSNRHHPTGSVHLITLHDNRNDTMSPPASHGQPLSAPDTIYLTPKQIAAMPEIDVSPETVRAWCRSGRLRCHRVGGLYRVSPEALREFLEHRGEPGEVVTGGRAAE